MSSDRYLIASVLILLLGPAAAQDAVPASAPVAVKISPDDAASWANVPGVLERCMSEAVLHADVSKCRNLHAYLSEFSARVKRAGDDASAAEKKAADDKKADDAKKTPAKPKP